MAKFAAPLLLVAWALLLGSIGDSYGSQEISITASKPAYTYGESLAFSINVSNVTGQNAVLEIVDRANQSSGPIPVIITKPTSNFTAPFPFYKTSYSPGTYFLKIKYDGEDAMTSFQVVDSGIIAIPPQFKIVAGLWADNQTSTNLFSTHIADLLSSGIFAADNYKVQNMTVVPSWFKSDAKWWSTGAISDNDFGRAVEYLLEAGIMKV